MQELYFKDSRSRIVLEYLIWYMELEWNRHHKNILQSQTTLARFQALHLMANFVSCANFLLLSMFDQSATIQNLSDVRNYIITNFPNIQEYRTPPEFQEPAYFIATAQETDNIKGWFTVKCVMQIQLMGQILKSLYIIYEPAEKAVEFLTRANHIDVYSVSRMPIYILAKIRKNEQIADMNAIYATVERVRIPYRKISSIMKDIPKNNNYITQNINSKGYTVPIYNKDPQENVAYRYNNQEQQRTPYNSNYPQGYEPEQRLQPSNQHRNPISQVKENNYMNQPIMEENNYYNRESAPEYTQDTPHMQQPRPYQSQRAVERRNIRNINRPSYRREQDQFAQPLTQNVQQNNQNQNYYNNSYNQPQNYPLMEEYQTEQNNQNQVNMQNPYALEQQPVVKKQKLPAKPQMAEIPTHPRLRKIETEE